ncbi:MAG: hypothetical protein M3449_01500 [Acidobacteriota bacterium]|nr:hypothetical protein [Blastocatellia bacterium]MDQ3489729.1 hypothetical protein [Acidobacteriota bacterium]
MAKKNSPSIEEIISKKWLVHYNRKPLDKYLLHGFVLACNDDFTLLNVFDNGLFILDGYCVLRNKDVKSYAVYDDENYFLNEVIRFKKIRPKFLPKISISSWIDLVRSIAESFPFLVVFTENLHKNECYIGKVTEIKAKSLLMLEIDPDACWENTTKYKFADVTMVKFGGHYENTLALVNAKRYDNQKG